MQTDSRVAPPQKIMQLSWTDCFRFRFVSIRPSLADQTDVVLCDACPRLRVVSSFLSCSRAQDSRQIEYHFAEIDSLFAYHAEKMSVSQNETVRFFFGSVCFGNSQKVRDSEFSGPPIASLRFPYLARRPRRASEQSNSQFKQQFFLAQCFPPFFLLRESRSAFRGNGRPKR